MGGVSQEEDEVYRQYIALGCPFTKYMERGSRWKKIRLFYKLMKSCDCWIIGGGGLFPGENTRTLLIFLFRLLTGKLAGCRICMYGIEINPVKKLKNKCLWKIIVGLQDFVGTRNEDTAVFLRNLGYKRVKNFSDVTFALKLECEQETSEKDEEYDIWSLAMPWTEEEMQTSHYVKRYEILCRQLAKLMEQSDRKVMLIPFFVLDIRFINDVVSLANNQCKYEIVEIDRNVFEKRSLFINARRCLCMRFHSLLFAIYCCRPFVAISYSPKSSLLLKEFEMEEFMVKFGVRNSEFYYKEFDLNLDNLRKIYADCSEDMLGTVRKASNKMKKMAKIGEGELIRWICNQK